MHVGLDIRGSLSWNCAEQPAGECLLDNPSIMKYLSSSIVVSNRSWHVKSWAVLIILAWNEISDDHDVSVDASVSLPFVYTQAMPFRPKNRSGKNWAPTKSCWFVFSMNWPGRTSSRRDCQTSMNSDDGCSYKNKVSVYFTLTMITRITATLFLLDRTILFQTYWSNHERCEQRKDYHALNSRVCLKKEKWFDQRYLR